MPKTIALDFDGFLHTYESGWTGPVPTDPPVPGAREFVDELLGRGFDLVIVSSRAETGEGLAGICGWLGKHGFPDIRVTYGKAQADAYIDDRAIPFLGDFDETRRLLDRLLDHPKWWVPLGEPGEEPPTPRREAEIRAEIARLEEWRSSSHPRQYQKVAVATRIEALRWTLGEEEWSP